jgi:hypothetical protein
MKRWPMRSSAFCFPNGADDGRYYDTVAEAPADLTRQPTPRIDVQIIRYGARRPVYRITYAGEVLINASRCPLFDSCRALLARGITGRLELWRPGKTTFDAACDIEVGAQWTILETDTEFPPTPEQMPILDEEPA